MWFLDQLQPQSPWYNLSVTLSLVGLLDEMALAESINEVVRRHEALRTTFPSVEGQPVQWIAARLTLDLPVVDFSRLDEERQQTLSRQLVAEESVRPFDLAAGPLVRALLLRLDDEEHRLFLNMHHIVSDGWSIGIFLRELTALYQGFFLGRPALLPRLPIQYADFACWEREWLSEERIEAKLAHWLKRLAGAPTVPILPTDRPRSALPRHRGATCFLQLSEPLTRDLKLLARRSETTLFMTLLAAFETLVLRHTGEEDFLLGTPIANRDHQEIEDLIGFFINTLVLRGEPSGNPSFLAWLREVRETTLDAYEHSDLPFQRLIEELKPERTLSHSPLFQMMFHLSNAPMDTWQTQSTFRQMPPESETAKFDLTLTWMAIGSELLGQVEYDRDLFDRSRIERLTGHLEALLRGAVTEPEQPLSELPLLSPAERQALLVEWSDGAETAAPGSLHGLFEAQVERAPKAVAVVFDAEPCPVRREQTYRQLDRQANRLARRLQALGVGPEVRVGVAIERSPALLVALLGILKAGGAYVPLDPAYPEERVRLLLEDQGTGMPLILTQEPLLPRLPTAILERGTRVLCLEREEQVFAGEERRERAPASKVLPENLAYVLYTSGSTGRPKGVAIEHRSAVALLVWARDAFDPEDLRRVFAGTSINFDLSVFELFAPLSWGGTVVLGADTLALATHRCAGEVTMINTVPSVLAELLRRSAVPPSARAVNLAGEPLRSSLAQRLHALGTVERVRNLYGPTEDTTYSTSARLAPGVQDEPAIGRPVTGTEVYLLDRRLLPVPVGAIGELYLAGSGLARGYLQQPEQTAQRFLPHPFAGRAGERMYRTGDLARYRACGQLEIVGRVDRQIKLRGFRIELGEIEAVLASHPRIAEAVVAVRDDGPENRRLVAYWVGSPEAPANGELRRLIRENLPQYMEPAAFLRLEHLPRLPNGKVDFDALPLPGEEDAEPEERFVAPRDEVEAELVRIWEEVLSIRSVGVTDDFFALGGHSFLSVQVSSRIETAFGRRLPVAALFRAPTIARLADLVRAPAVPRARSPWVALQNAGLRPPLLCVQGVLKFRQLARLLGPDQPSYAFPAHELDDLEPPYKIEEIARGYVRQIRELQPQGPYALAGWCLGGLLAYEIAQQLENDGQRIALLVLIDTSSPSAEVGPNGRPHGMRLGHLTRRLRFHVDRFRSLRAADRLPYLRERLHSLMRYHLAPRILRAAHWTGLELGRDLHPKLRDPGLMTLEAAHDYVPRSFAGPLLLMLSTDRPPREIHEMQVGWERLVGKRVETLEVQGNHETLFEEPHVGFVAQELGARLRKAQEAPACISGFTTAG